MVGGLAHWIPVIREGRRENVSILFWIFVFGFVSFFATLSNGGFWLQGSDMFDTVDKKNILFFSAQIGLASFTAFGTLALRYIVAAKTPWEARRPIED